MGSGEVKEIGFTAMGLSGLLNPAGSDNDKNNRVIDDFRGDSFFCEY